MTRKLQLLVFIFLGGMVFILSGCSEEDDKPSFPLTAEIFHSTSEYQVAFTALTHSATTWLWDFGDGNTSTEKEPVHVYESGGEYFVTLTAEDDKGNSVTKEVRVAIALSPYTMLVGNHNAEGYQGKTWRLSPEHDPLGDYFADADADFTEVQDMSHGILGNIGFGAAYEDQFTFHYDQSYAMDMKSDGASFGGVVYQVVLNGGQDIIHMNEDFGLALATFTPDTDATFTFTENEDFVVQSVYGELKFEDVMTLDFSGTAFLGFRDFQQKVVVRSLSDSRMQIIAFMAAGQSPAIIGVNTHALFLTLEAVN